MTTQRVEVNYDSEPVAEATIGPTHYRIDAGKQGTAICISSRSPGSWDWSYICEARWDGSELRTKELERDVRVVLSKAIASAMQD
ncbi:MAG TPA: hypothetical protein VHM70_29795 [Polyangiaceae bacterium]|jgi:hypothetical protein|nr:hypothetical protein [Polyangiaceae bacterium]